MRTDTGLRPLRKPFRRKPLIVERSVGEQEYIELREQLSFYAMSSVPPIPYHIADRQRVYAQMQKQRDEHLERFREWKRNGYKNEEKPVIKPFTYDLSFLEEKEETKPETALDRIKRLWRGE